jgi:large subunit ribosomal protein L21
MYALIESGCKQYRVEEGAEIAIERISQEGTVRFDRVLLVQDGETPLVGAPYLSKWIVQGEIIGETKSAKVICYKYKKRKRSRRTVGHRQKYCRVKITKIAKA